MATEYGMRTILRRVILFEVCARVLLVFDDVFKKTGIERVVNGARAARVVVVSRRTIINAHCTQASNKTLYGCCTSSISYSVFDGYTSRTF